MDWCSQSTLFHSLCVVASMMDGNCKSYIWKWLGLPSLLLWCRPNQQEHASAPPEVHTPFIWTGENPSCTQVNRMQGSEICRSDHLYIVRVEGLGGIGPSHQQASLQGDPGKRSSQLDRVQFWSKASRARPWSWE